jgi:hypothetical protein
MPNAFHVTAHSRASEITEHGLKPSQEGEWRQKRKQLRKKVDSYAQNYTDNWVPREGANFFWTSIPDAMDFIERTTERYDECVIVTVQLTETPLWAARSEFIEDMYHSWMNDEDITDKLPQLPDYLDKWEGSQIHGYEIWSQEHIPPEQIVQID